MNVPLRFRRRDLFKSFAAAALLGPVLRATDARAAGAPIKRFVALCHPNGKAYLNIGGPSGPETGFQLGTFYSAALERHRADTLALTGVRLGGVPYGSEAAEDGGHGSGGWACLTCTSSKNTGAATGPSVDQLIARKLYEQGLAPSARAPVFCVGASGGRWQSFYESAGTAVPLITSPTQAFAGLFSGVMGGGNPGAAAAAAAVARKRSILDAAWQDCKTAMPALPTEGRAQLDYHCERIRDLERALQAPPPMMQACTPPAVPAALANVDTSNPNNYPALADWFMKLIEAAFVCDVTRVASFTFGVPSVRFNMPWLNLPTYDFGSGISGNDHHTYSHGELPAQLARFVGWYAEKFSSLLDKLKAPQPDGTRLLDSTLVHWTGEIGNTWPAGAGGALHDIGDHTMFVFGSMGGTFRTGRHLAFPTTHFIGDQSDQAKVEARPHHALMVSLIQAMGITGVNQFGDPAGGSGTLARLY